MKKGKYRVLGAKANASKNSKTSRKSKIFWGMKRAALTSDNRKKGKKK